MPGARASFAEGGGPDKRSYQVDCSKIARVAARLPAAVDRPPRGRAAPRRLRAQRARRSRSSPARAICGSTGSASSRRPAGSTTSCAGGCRSPPADRPGPAGARRMIFTPTRLEDAFLIDVERHADERGFLARTFCERSSPSTACRCGSSRAARSTARGAIRCAACTTRRRRTREIKLVRCTRGSIFLVMVDLRPDSPTRNDWLGVELSARERAPRVRPRGVRAGLPDARGRHRGPLPDVAPLRAARPPAGCAGTTRRSASTGRRPSSASSPSATARGPTSSGEPDAALGGFRSRSSASSTTRTSAGGCLDRSIAEHRDEAVGRVPADRQRRRRVRDRGSGAQPWCRR